MKRITLLGFIGLLLALSCHAQSPCASVVPNSVTIPASGGYSSQITATFYNDLPGTDNCGIHAAIDAQLSGQSTPGGAFLVGISVTEEPAPTFNWLFVDEVFAGPNTSCSTKTFVFSNSFGETLTATQPGGCSCSNLSIVTTSLANGTVNSAYSQSIAAQGGTPPYTWSVSGLPTGLTAATQTDQTELISGTPTQNGTSTISLQVTDSLGCTATKTLTLQVQGCQVTIPPPPDGSGWSQADAQWGGQPYDHTAPNADGSTVTIQQQGCTLTALAACLATAGYSNPVTGILYDPGTLNTAFDGISGAYSPQSICPTSGLTSTGLPCTPGLVVPGSGGALVPSSAVTSIGHNSLTLDESQNTFLQNVPPPGQPIPQIDYFVCAARPKPVLVQVPGSAASGGKHFVLVTGKDSSGNYSVLDPGHRANNSLSNFSQFAVRGAVKNTNGDPSALTFVVSDWATLLVTAPDGSKTGYDPVSQQEVKGLTQSAYLAQDNSVDTDTETMPATSTVYSVDFSFPPDGTYTVQLVGLQSGMYQLTINAFDTNGAQESYIVKPGVAAKGSSSAFQVKFSSVPGSAPAVTRTATFASTLADIANSLQLGLIDDAGIANSLSSKINAASDAIAGGDKTTASNILNAFENQLSAQAGKHITGVTPQVLQEDADSLVAELQDVSGT